jgi:hypothetical protein
MVSIVSNENAKIDDIVSHSGISKGSIFWSMLDGSTIQTIYKDFLYQLAIRDMKHMYLKQIKA